MGKLQEWLACSDLSPELFAGKFLAFKSPLTHHLKDNIFNVTSVFDHLKANQLEMGLWIDLMAKNRYDANEVTSQGCRYVNVRMSNKPLDKRNTKRLIESIRDFIEANPDKIVGIHCYHGHNRTGFVIISAMVEIYKWDVEEAIAKFTSVRPPGIYRKVHLDELRKRYGGNLGPNELPGPSETTEEEKKKENEREKFPLDAFDQRKAKEVNKERNWREYRDGPNLYFKKDGRNGRIKNLSKKKIQRRNVILKKGNEDGTSVITGDEFNGST